MRGRLTEFSVGDLLQLYQLAGKTGTLQVTHQNTRHTLYFDRGHVIGAGADGWHLLDELRRIEWLPAEIRQQIDLMERDGGFVGLSLIARALISPGAWDQFVQRQIEELVYPILGWRAGEFTATVDVVPHVPPLRVNQQPQQLILNAARWEEELRAAERDGLRRDVAWIATEQQPIATDDPATARLIALLRRPRSAVDLSAAAGQSLLTVIQLLRVLRHDGAIVVAAERSSGSGTTS